MNHELDWRCYCPNCFRPDDNNGSASIVYNSEYYGLPAGWSKFGLRLDFSLFSPFTSLRWKMNQCLYSIYTVLYMYIYMILILSFYSSISTSINDLDVFTSWPVAYCFVPSTYALRILEEGDVSLVLDLFMTHIVLLRPHKMDFVVLVHRPHRLQLQPPAVFFLFSNKKNPACRTVVGRKKTPALFGSTKQIRPHCFGSPSKTK